MNSGNLVFRVHAIERMFERDISVAEVREVVEKGRTIREYPDDQPYPSRLILGFVHFRPIHVVAAEDKELQTTIVITAYEPDPQMWEPGFERRRDS